MSRLSSDRRPLVAYADGPDLAASAPTDFVGSAPDVLLGWTPHLRPWIDRSLHGSTVMAGYALADAVADDTLAYLPTRLSGVPRLVEQLRPDVVVVPAIRRGRELAYTGSVGWAPHVSAATSRIVVEVDPDGVDVGAPLVELPIAQTTSACRPVTSLPGFDPSPVDRRVAEHVISVLPPRPTLQFGPGGVASAIVRMLDRPVGIWSGLLTDDVAALADGGLLRDAAVGAYAWGGNALTGLCRSGGARLTSIGETHDPARIAGVESFVSLNTALQIGLDGAVNVERVGGRLVAGMGGHPDFCAAAARTPGAISVIALRAARRDRSNIVARVETVSTPRCDVDVVVTEHGVADLRGLDDAARAARIVAVAAPEHRADLERQMAG